MRGRPRKPPEERAEHKVLVAIRAGARSYGEMEVATSLSGSTVRLATHRLLKAGEIVRKYSEKTVTDKYGAYRHKHKDPFFYPKDSDGTPPGSAEATE